MEYSSLIRPEFADGSHLHHERAMAKKELVICAATLSSILRNQPHQPKRNSTVLIRVADVAGTEGGLSRKADLCRIHRSS
jgi:hypothetical protein